MLYNNVYPKYKEKPIVPTKTASYELVKVGIALEDVVEILENGFDCSSGKRKKDTLEIGLQKGNSMLKVVIIEKKDKFLLIHIGKLTYSKRLKKKLKK